MNKPLGSELGCEVILAHPEERMECAKIELLVKAKLFVVDPSSNLPHPQRTGESLVSKRESLFDTRDLFIPEVNDAASTAHLCGYTVQRSEWY